MSLIAPENLAKTFVLTNPEATAVTIARVQTSCGCTSALLTADKQTQNQPMAMPLTLAPGASVNLQVAIDPARVEPGALTKQVWVWAKDQNEAAATITLTGTLVGAATMTPTILNFGTVPAGEAKLMTFQVKYDNCAIAHNPLPEIVSSNPDVHLTESTAMPVKDKDSLTKTYNALLIGTASLGLIQGTITLIPHNAAATGLQSWRVAPEVIAGQVVGPVTATPMAVNFGTVPVGKEAHQQIVLKGSAEMLALPITTTPGYPDITATAFAPVDRPASAKASGADQTLILDVVLKPTRVAGTLQTQMAILFKNGQRMTFPVTAYVPSKPSSQAGQ